MALYSYKGLGPDGKEVKNTVNAESESQAKQKIKSLGLMIISIKEQKATSSKDATSVSFVNAVKVEDLSLMTRQLATLLKAKIQIVEAFSALVDQTENPQLKIMLAEVRQKVNEGSSLAQAFGEYPRVFDNVFVNMLDAGEASGNLDIVLLRLAEFTENRVKLNNKIKGAMTYPLIMVVFATIMMGAIFSFVIPKITKILISQKVELPLPTKIAIGISDGVKNYWWLMILGTVTIIYLFLKYIKTKKGEENWHLFLLKMPVVKDIVVMINVSRFCSTLSTLLSSGVPILAAMRIVGNIVTNVHMKKVVEKSRINITEGGSIAEPLAESGLFPTMMTHMLTLGERSGEVEEMLNIVAENYQDELDTKLSRLTTILEPLMLIGMGLAVLFIVFSVVMPMMQMGNLTR
ncbi:MAG: type II secretion system F family protein [Bacteriovoracaceae bacterium]|nr:type II secretion system F family protein [Bacteriovoracaceae bacterium]